MLLRVPRVYFISAISALKTHGENCTNQLSGSFSASIQKKYKSAENTEKIHVEIVTDNKEKALNVLRSTKWSGSLANSPDGTIVLEMKKANIPDLTRQLVSNDINIFSLRPKHSLEDYFLSVTKH